MAWPENIRTREKAKVMKQDGMKEPVSDSHRGGAEPML
jgi:hypothetical protein